MKPALRRLAPVRRAALVLATWLLVVHIIGVALFTSGLLLTRPVLEYSSTSHSTTRPPFSRVVVLIVDALRYDFVAPQLEDSPCHNQFQLPDGGVLARFLADPPTTTLQRLKGLTTGSLPAFIDAGSNFAGTQIDEDNWVKQAAQAGGAAFAGDDTWAALYGHIFNESMPYPSLNVRDLHTVDQGVMKHLPQLISSTEYPVVIGHMLGVDHVGHRYGPEHPEMALKLQETAKFVRGVAENLPENTVLAVFGDHGMDYTGNHGGDSPDELNAALWVWSKAGFNSLGKDEIVVRQTDFVPTISGWLGLPVPYNSLGYPIEAVFQPPSVRPGIFGDVVASTVAQIETYAAAVGQPARRSDETPRMYQQRTLEALQAIWVKFDDARISFGITVIGSSMIAIAALYNAATWQTLPAIAKATTWGGILGAVCSVVLFLLNAGKLVAVGTIALGATLGLLASSVLNVTWQSPSWASMGGIGILAIEIASGFSNSFVIWESRVLLWCVVSILAVLGFFSANSSNAVRARLGPQCAFTVAALARLANCWVVCREENGSLCSTTFYSQGTTLVPMWTLLALSVVTALLPWFLRRFWSIGGNYRGISAQILGGLPFALLISVIYWSLDTMESLGYAQVPGMATIKVVLSRLALVIWPFGTYIWWRSSLAIGLEIRDGKFTEKLYGFTNAYGSYAALVVLPLFSALAAVNKPPATLSLAALLWACFGALDLLDLTDTKYTLLAPVLLDAFGSGWFYWTGHQATIQTIQWDTAFVATPVLSKLWSPLAVILNSVGPWILTTILAVTSALWRRPPFRESRQPVGLVLRQAAGVSLVAGLRSLGSICTAAMLRRHLMTWKIFVPRFMLGGIVLVVVDAAAVAAVLVTGHTTTLVTDIFG